MQHASFIPLPHSNIRMYSSVRQSAKVTDFFGFWAVGTFTIWYFLEGDLWKSAGQINSSIFFTSMIFQQGSDLIELRVTWRETENLIFWRFLMIFGEFLGDFWKFFEEFWRNWFVVRRRLRTSINWRPTKKMRFWGHYGLQTASEVTSDIRFQIYGPNYICYHVCLDCLDLLLNFVRKKEERKKQTTRLY